MGGARAQRIRVGVFATDASYWQFYLGYKGVNVSLSSAVLNASDTLSCWFGAARVPATLLPSGEHVRCAAPTSAAAGALPYRHEEFGGAPEGTTLYGVAAITGAGIWRHR